MDEAFVISEMIMVEVSDIPETFLNLFIVSMAKLLQSADWWGGV